MGKDRNFERNPRKRRDSDHTQSQIKSLLADLRSGDGGVRRSARQNLTFIGKPAVRHLIPLLKDPVEDVRWEATKALVDIADTTTAVELVDTLDDPNFGVRWLAAEGLIAIGRDALMPLLQALINQSDSIWLREGAHHVFHDIGKRDAHLKNLMDPVIASLEGVEPEIAVREPARNALQALGS